MAGFDRGWEVCATHRSRRRNEGVGPHRTGRPFALPSTCLQGPGLDGGWRLQGGVSVKDACTTSWLSSSHFSKHSCCLRSKHFKQACMATSLLLFALLAQITTSKRSQSYAFESSVCNREPVDGSGGQQQLQKNIYRLCVVPPSVSLLAPHLDVVGRLLLEISLTSSPARHAQLHDTFHAAQISVLRHHGRRASCTCTDSGDDRHTPSQLLTRALPGTLLTQTIGVPAKIRPSWLAKSMHLKPCAQEAPSGTWLKFLVLFSLSMVVK